MTFDTRMKDIYDLEMGISIVFKILGQFLIKGGLDNPEWS
jgi:hypothetical protein